MHTLLCIAYFQDRYKVTSQFIAGSVGVNAVIVRRLLQSLKAKGYVSVPRGTGGYKLDMAPSDITLRAIYACVIDSDEEGLFSFHSQPNSQCPVGSHIHDVLDGALKGASDAFLNSLGGVTLDALLSALPPKE